jgi:lysophospholipase L1-like esterase
MKKKTNLRRSMCLLLFLTFNSLLCFSQNNFSVKRKILDADDNLLPGVFFKFQSRARQISRCRERLRKKFVYAIEITPNKTAATIFLAGNSTVVDPDREPWAAWGQMFPRFFIPNKIAVANYAESGETLKAFKGERRLEKIWSMAKPGDYLFIEFTHNDQKPGGNYLEPFTTYKQTLKEWIAEARKRKITPVLVTSMHRRSFDSAGHITNTLSDYPEAMRQTAKEESVTLIDLNAMSKILYEAWGPGRSIKAFVHYPANTFPAQKEELKDNTHFNPYGAYELARCVVQSIKEQQLPLTKYLKKDVSLFNPAHPDTLEKWYWPLSTMMSSVKPDGN